MAIVNYNPLRELRTMQERMNRLLDLAWHNDAGEDLREGVWQPPVDIYESPREIVIKAEVPDVDQHDIEVRIEESTLTLRGERKPNASVKKETYHRMERFYGTFSRSFSLPSTVNQEHIKATCEKGVLTIILPKKGNLKLTQVTVEVIR